MSVYNCNLQCIQLIELKNISRRNVINPLCNPLESAGVNNFNYFYNDSSRNSKSDFEKIKWSGIDRLSNIWPKYILLSSWKIFKLSAKQGADRSLKMTTLSKQICIKNKINLSSVN